MTSLHPISRDEAPTLRNLFELREGEKLLGFALARRGSRITRATDVAWDVFRLADRR